MSQEKEVIRNTKCLNKFVDSVINEKGYKKFKAAVSVFKEGIGIQPDQNIELFLTRSLKIFARLHSDRGEHAIAIKLWKGALKLDPSSSKEIKDNLSHSLSELAFEKYNAQKYYASAKLLNKALKISPNDLVLKQNLSISFDALGKKHYFAKNFEKAVILGREALKLDPTNVITKKNLFDSIKSLLTENYNAGKCEIAAILGMEGVRLDPNDDEMKGFLAESLKKCAEVKSTSKDFDSAIGRLKLALIFFPNDDDFKKLLNISYMDSLVTKLKDEKYEYALAVAKEAFKAYPENSMLKTLLLLSWKKVIVEKFNSGQFKDTIDKIMEAQEAFPGNWIENLKTSVNQLCVELDSRKQNELTTFLKQLLSQQTNQNFDLLNYVLGTSLDRLCFEKADCGKYKAAIVLRQLSLQLKPEGDKDGLLKDLLPYLCEGLAWKRFSESNFKKSLDLLAKAVDLSQEAKNREAEVLAVLTRAKQAVQNEPDLIKLIDHVKESADELSRNELTLALDALSRTLPKKELRDLLYRTKDCFPQGNKHLPEIQSRASDTHKNEEGNEDYLWAESLLTMIELSSPAAKELEALLGDAVPETMES